MSFIDRDGARPGLRAALLVAWCLVGPMTAIPARAEVPPRKPAEVLAGVWPGAPEWSLMLADILGGSQLGPGDGWFRTATARTRFDWEATRKSLDRDGDGAVTPPEFAGPPADFARLDRDHDGALTAADFDFSAHALAPSPGAMLFYGADRDGNGKVTREEFDALFGALDRDRAGFLSLGDLQQALSPPAPPARPRPQAAAPPNPGSGGPSRWTLVKGLFRQEIGSLQPGPGLGEVAPDFTLKTADGAQEITLSGREGSKPVVLVFGNFTCGPFRYQAGNVEKLARRYKDRAEFLMVYVREAHPTDGWHMASNERVGVALRQPRSYEERVGVAQTCGKALGLGMPMLVDTLDDAVGARYSGMPSRLYLLDRAGKVAYKSGRGPFGFKPAELEHSLLLLLRDEAAPATPGAAGAPEAR